MILTNAKRSEIEIRLDDVKKLIELGTPATRSLASVCLATIIADLMPAIDGMEFLSEANFDIGERIQSAYLELA